MTGSGRGGRGTLLFVLLAVLLGFPANPVLATKDLMVVTSNTTLTEDHHGEITIDTDGVTLDCAGHTVFLTEGFNSGVGIGSNGDDVTVRNCVVNAGVHRDLGIALAGDRNHLENNRVIGGWEGIRIVSRGNTLVSNVVSRSVTGISVYERGNTLVGNDVSESVIGIWFLGSDANTVTGNVVWGNTSSGFEWTVAGPDEENDLPLGFEPSVFRSNEAYRNGSWGFGDVSQRWKGGPGPGGVWNIYEDNICAANGEDPQSRPEGLCTVLVGRFVDDEDNTFESAIDWLAKEGLTNGCDPPMNIRYCPNDSITRGELAVFLVRAMDYSDNGGGDLFIDDDGLFYENSADRLKTAKVTVGCNPPTNNKYCGERSVTRGQMAAFLARAFQLPAYTGPDRFIDDNGNIFEGAIEKLAQAGITVGCNPPINNKFCPDAPVTRGQMAAFLKRALS